MRETPRRPDGIAAGATPLSPLKINRYRPADAYDEEEEDGLGTQATATNGVLMEVRIHEWRLLLATVVLVLSLAAVTFALQQGFELATLKPGESLSLPFSKTKNVSKQVDELNSYSGNVTSVLSALWAIGLQLVVYVLLLGVAPSLMIDNSTLLARAATLVITGGIGWLAVQGFVATNVQLKPKTIVPVLSFADLNGFDRASMVDFQNFTPFVPNASQNPQLSTSTLLRTAISGSYPREITACSVFNEGDHDVSVSFGFSSYDWLHHLLPKGAEYTASFLSQMNASESASTSLPMSQRNATSLAVYALDMIDTFFQVQSVMNMTPYESLWRQYQSHDTREDANGFLSAFKGLIYSTLEDSKPHFQHFSVPEASVEFTHSDLSKEIVFDAVTFEIPLKRNFFSRTLNATLVNATTGDSSTLTYVTELVDVEEDEDAIYEMSVWDVCTPNGCMLTGLNEVNGDGKAMYPESQVRAVRTCLDADGNEDVEGTITGCMGGLSTDSFLVFSIASRIEGEEMVANNAPESKRWLKALQERSIDGKANAVGAPSESISAETDSSNLDVSSSQDEASLGPVPAPIPANGIPGGEPDGQTSSTTDSLPVVSDPKEDDDTPSTDTTMSDVPRTTTPSPTFIPINGIPGGSPDNSVAGSKPALPTTHERGSLNEPSTSSAASVLSTSASSSGASNEGALSPGSIPDNGIPGGDTDERPESNTDALPVINPIHSASATSSGGSLSDGSRGTDVTPVPLQIPRNGIPGDNAEAEGRTGSSAADVATDSAQSGSEVSSTRSAAITPVSDSISESSGSSSTNSMPSTSSSAPRHRTKVFSLAAPASEELASVLTRKAHLKNARKIYTITVGRVSWSLQDLANRFNAQCETTYNLDCLGLTFPLNNSFKHLVVGRQYLPLSNLRAYSGSSYQWTPLAKIKRDSGFGGDFAFKRAFTESNWPEDLNRTACKSSREEYIVSSLDNHLYSQHSLQPAYTASLMWLFQYGTANDGIHIGEGKSSLAFAANVINNGVIISTPTNSSYLTYAACGVILLATMWVTVKAQRHRSLQSHRSVSAHAVTAVLLNDTQYPPIFVKCIVHPPGRSIAERGGRELDHLRAFNICGVELRHSENPELCQSVSDDLKESIRHGSAA